MLAVKSCVEYSHFITTIIFMFSAILGVYIILWRIAKTLKKDVEESLRNFTIAMSRMDNSTVKEKFCDERHGGLEGSFKSHCAAVANQFETMRKEIREDLQIIFEKLDKLGRKGE